MRIGIFGGGLAGLSLGYLLRKKNLNITILEREPECGGLMRSLYKDGFTFDYSGSHIIFSRNKKILEFMTRLLDDNIIVKQRRTKIFYKGNYIKYPFENGLADLPKKDNFECLYYFLDNLIQNKNLGVKKPENLLEWFYFNFGRGISEKYLIPYNLKIWKYPLEKLNLDWVERIPQPPIEDIIKSSLGIETEGYVHQLSFYYPKFGGIQAIINSLEAEVQECIINNYEVKIIIKTQDDKWVVSNGKEKFIFDKIISTIPIFELMKGLNAPNNVKIAANNLKYNSMITVMMGLSIPCLNDLTWLYISDADILTHRISFPSNYSPYVVPFGKTSILAEITCSLGDSIWNMSDDEIIKRTIRDLHRLGIIPKMEALCFTAIKRIKYAYVINDLNYPANVNEIYAYLENSGIGILGRFSEFKYLNMDDVIEHAIIYSNRY